MREDDLAQPPRVTVGGTTFLPAGDLETLNLGLAVTLFDGMGANQRARVLTYLAMRYGVNINMRSVEDK